MLGGYRYKGSYTRRKRRRHGGKKNNKSRRIKYM